MTEIAYAPHGPGTQIEAGTQRLAVLRDLIALTRPRVLSLVLFTAPAALVLGQPGWPGAWLVFGVVAGCALLGAGCSALNAWYERDRDAHMARTANRPLPAGRLGASQALSFGLAVSALGLLILFGVGGVLPTAIGLASLLHYVFVYTIWLKPRTPHAVVVGGVAGGIAPVIADAALDGRIGPWSLMLFAIVFVWQLPHFWAIALYRSEEYAAAGFPMLPHTVGEEATRSRQLIGAIVLLPLTLLPMLSGQLGVPYLLTAVAGGAWFITRIGQAISERSGEADRRVFKASLVQLSCLFGVMLVELLLS